MKNEHINTLFFLVKVRKKEVFAKSFNLNWKRAYSIIKTRNFYPEECFL